MVYSDSEVREFLEAVDKDNTFLFRELARDPEHYLDMFTQYKNEDVTLSYLLNFILQRKKDGTVTFKFKYNDNGNWNELKGLLPEVCDKLRAITDVLDGAKPPTINLQKLKHFFSPPDPVTILPKETIQKLTTQEADALLEQRDNPSNMFVQMERFNRIQTLILFNREKVIPHPPASTFVTQLASLRDTPGFTPTEKMHLTTLIKKLQTAATNEFALKIAAFAQANAQAYELPTVYSFVDSLPYSPSPNDVLKLLPVEDITFITQNNLDPVKIWEGCDYSACIIHKQEIAELRF